jgi:LAO/AO transport system kinase
MTSLAPGHQAWLDTMAQGEGPAARRALAKSITLIESRLAQDRVAADALLTAALPRTGRSLRLGISGVPGVGKSTLIETLGLHLIALGHRVAVLAVDPSSVVSGGSILGDKTRMERLSVHERAFIRPSPSGGNLGGVAASTREAMLLCEAAGYDIVIVETVGVGQSEIAVAGMTDMFVLMLLPNAGDELQAIKRGIMEMADLVLINKADLDADAATRAQAQLVSTLRILAGHAQAQQQAGDKFWAPQVMLLSALQATGVEAMWAVVGQFRARTQAIRARRARQAADWLNERIEAGLTQWFWSLPGMDHALADTLREVRLGKLAASTGARRLLALAKASSAGRRA